MHMEVFSLESIDTVARRIIEYVREQHAHGVTLVGNLGAGKTTLAQAIGRALGVTDVISSPTFVLMRRYETKDGTWPTYVHCDAYRIENETEASRLRLNEYEESFLCIEWPERLSGALPGKLVQLELSSVSEDKRGIIGL